MFHIVDVNMLKTVYRIYTHKKFISLCVCRLITGIFNVFKPNERERMIQVVDRAHA